MVSVLAYVGAFVVSIPRSGFWVVIRQMPQLWGEDDGRFNPSVGILGGDSLNYEADEVCSYIVSIPRSGFWVVILEYLAGKFVVLVNVSIPRSGFWVVIRS